MATKLKSGPLSPVHMWCGQDNQTAEHILQACPNYSSLRQTVWAMETPLQVKLYGPTTGTGEDSTLSLEHRTDSVANRRTTRRRIALFFIRNELTALYTVTQHLTTTTMVVMVMYTCIALPLHFTVACSVLVRARRNLPLSRERQRMRLTSR